MLVVFVTIAAAFVAPVLAILAANTPEISYTAFGVIALFIVPSVAESCSCVRPLAEVVAVKTLNVVPFNPRPLPALYVVSPSTAEPLK